MNGEAMSHGWLVFFGNNQPNQMKGAKVMKPAVKTIVTIIGALFTAAVVLLAPSISDATTVTMSDSNSTVLVNPDGSNGVFNWTVDGVNQLKKEWYWFRLAGAGAQTRLDTLPVTYTAPTPNLLRATYSGTGFSIQLLLSLSGGTPGSGNSDLSGSIKIATRQRPAGISFLPVCGP